MCLEEHIWLTDPVINEAQYLVGAQFGGVGGLWDTFLGGGLMFKKQGKFL